MYPKVSPTTLKKHIIKLVKEDEEFRYILANILGFQEILERLDRHEKILLRHGRKDYWY